MFKTILALILAVVITGFVINLMFWVASGIFKFVFNFGLILIVAVFAFPLFLLLKKKLFK